MKAHYPLRRVLAFCALLGLCGAAIAQEPPPPKPDGVADRYLEIREAGQRNLAASLATAGRTANLAAIRALVNANLKHRNYAMKITGATPERLQSIDVEDVAQFLAVLGYTAKDLAPGNARALRLVESASRAVLGGSSLRDMVFLSPVVIVGEVVSHNPDTQTDSAYRSTANVRVTESLKGGIPVGTTVAFRQQSGPVPGGLYLQMSSEIPRDAKGPYLLFLSDAAYEIRGRGGRKGDPSSRIYSTAGTPHRVLAGSVSPIGDSESEGGTLADVRSYASE